MRYRILTTTQALRDDGTAVTLGGARLRALLTVLALRVGRTVPSGVLVDEVWGDEPPADASGALQALVARLRRTLGHSAVASVDGGYRLCAEADDVDLYRFDRLAGEGARALDEGDPAKAAGLLADALALWRGAVLADLPDRTAEAARWEARHLDARRVALTAALALGRAEETLPELAALCGGHPIDEPLQALRIRALRDAGRAAQALAAYEEVRRDLADRLGADPGPELRSLHAELLAPQSVAPHPAAPHRAAHRTSPDLTARTSTAQASTAQPPTVQHPSAGQQSVRQRSGPGGDAPATPAVGVRPPGNLRARLTSFVGRESDIDALRGDLGRARLVTLLGPGGAGKTRLSQEAAEAAAGTWPDGVWLAELAPVDDPETVPEAVLTALGARQTVLRGAGAEEIRAVERQSDDPLARLAEHCSRRRMLLLLDNCEHVIGAAAELADELLAHCPELTILATSREPLGVPGEVVRPLEPLPQPSALRLLAERGAAARPGFRVDDDPAAAAEICRRLDGLPLAIELAAARLRMLTPRQIADRLDDRFRLLTGGARTILPRQQTLRAVVDWSWDLLDEGERTVLRRLSVFAGGCGLAATEEVCGPEALDRLGSLVDKSLVVAAPTAEGEMRYRLLETVGEYAAERLDEAGDRAEAEHRHLVHYRELARLADARLRGPGQRAAIDLLEREYENLRTALRRAVATRAEHEALVLVHALAWFWQMRDLRADARHWSEVTAALGPDPFEAPVAQAPPLHERCTDAPPPMGPELLEEARRGVRLIHLTTADQEFDDWTTPESVDRLSRVAQAYRPGLPQTCRLPGSLWFFAIVVAGDAERLKAVLDETVRACRDYGYVWELAMALQMRANILANRSDWAGDATQDADESLKIFTRIGDMWGAAEALSARGEARERQGDFRRAGEDYHSALVYAEQLGAQGQVLVLRARYAGTLVESGRGEEGEVLLRSILEEDSQPGAGHEVWPLARMYIAMWLGRTGRIDEARAELDLLMERFSSGALVVFEGFVLGLIAWLDNEVGLYGDALGKAREAYLRTRDPLSQMVAPQMAAAHLATYAWALTGPGEPDRAREAVQLLAVADAQLPAGHFLTPLERANRERAEALARAALGDAGFDTAYAEGGGLTIEEATALVERRGE
ncbi:AfsR/SARP family transcriptional regulator [Streptomyces sp. NBC_01766]|uniref:AfsR/SARP family transcriptional regulator n=1 Tax=Streptomyces sp. NBC_01766 TaxID=2975936 RepID=UPI002DDBB094|nr:BTAD domain-containing putative transcriptional regulator [Streptomyces sp. NBC_01766]WSC22867.1 winged helix-turn-helix domain-containing protein [Streptomyces sp. NBC_01766]